ncbi:MAG TPA: TOBE domain-containing protein, partial [Candidatus Limnocylindrales bacterium]|nr:TOBE domain-containing protein [Candidatus Limnocylindrales bacterium]
GANVVDATVGDVLNLGPDTRYELVLDGGQRVSVREARRGDGRPMDHGDRIRIAWSIDDGLLVADPGAAEGSGP